MCPLLSCSVVTSFSLRMPQRMTLTVGFVTMEEMCSAVISVLECSTFSVLVCQVHQREMKSGTVLFVRWEDERERERESESESMISLSVYLVIHFCCMYTQSALLSLFIMCCLVSGACSWMILTKLSLSQNIARKTKRSRPANLKDLLLLAVNRMMFQGVSPHLVYGL